MKYDRAIVIGASSGIGREIVRQLASAGTHVVAGARRMDKLENLASEFPDLVTPWQVDVREPDMAAKAFQDMCQQLNGLDLFVYAAGVMPTVGPEEFSTAKDIEIIKVNFEGAVAWLNQAAIRFGNTRCGTIVAIGSVAGDRGRAAQPAYNASKAALATYMEALRNRLATQGVIVTTAKPGQVLTEMTSHLDLKGAMSAEEAAGRILAGAGKGGEHYLKLTHRIVFAIIRLIPSFIFRRLKI